MTQEQEAIEVLAEVASLPGGQEDLQRILEFLQALRAAAAIGEAEAMAVIDDFKAKIILNQALPWWDWGEIGAGEP